MGAHPLVSDYMTSAPITLSPEDTLLQALETMRLRGVRRLPVTVAGTPVVSDGRLAGILTGNDLAHALVDVLRTAKPAEPA